MLWRRTQGKEVWACTDFGDASSAYIPTDQPNPICFFFSSLLPPVAFFISWPIERSDFLVAYRNEILLKNL